jgi:hypothetical protein
MESMGLPTIGTAHRHHREDSPMRPKLSTPFPPSLLNRIARQTRTPRAWETTLVVGNDLIAYGRLSCGEWFVPETAEVAHTIEFSLPDTVRAPYEPTSPEPGHTWLTGYVGIRRASALRTLTGLGGARPNRPWANVAIAGMDDRLETLLASLFADYTYLDITVECARATPSPYSGLGMHHGQTRIQIDGTRCTLPATLALTLGSAPRRPVLVRANAF